MMLRRLSLFLLLLLALGTQLDAQRVQPVQHRSPDGRFTWVTYPGDPAGAQIYTLQNGLTVILSVNRAEPRIQTLIAVRAGSKNDPATQTGLAHYLEHMLFKGTDRFGTRDWISESRYISEIEDLYEKYNKTTDPTLRTAIYHIIDSVSGVAAGYAIPNEYDKLISSIGSQGTNAFTSNEQTVYVNDIPSNQIDKWLRIEAERFRAPVFRLFHTELEAVYEEKNISLDNEDRKVSQEAMAGLFHNHGYGTQTTIGTIEHLKNPSLKEIRKYYETYYVPNNMAVIMVGDLDPAATIDMIAKHFGSMKPSPSVPAYTFKPEAPRSAPDVRNVYGTEAESLLMGFRFPGAGTRDALILEITDLLLAYKGSGLLDINLNQSQRVQNAGSSPRVLKDYSIHWFTGAPKQGQKLEEVKDLIMGEIAKIKHGEFDEDVLRAVIRNLKVDNIEQFESNAGRAYTIMDAYTTWQNWGNYFSKIDAMKSVTKKDIVEFANKYYGNDYVVVYKRIGEKATVAKVEKPEITPIPLNRDDVSPFVQALVSDDAPPMQPMFLDYQKDLTRLALKNGVPLLYVNNSENELFRLTYVFDMGSRNDPSLPIALKYVKYLGTSKYSADEIARQFFNLGCQFTISSSGEESTIALTGLRESFEPALKLLEALLADAQPDQQVLDRLITQEIKLRTDAKLDKNSVLWGGLYNYAMYGATNPFTTRLSDKELRELKAADMVRTVRDLRGYRHVILYYGPDAGDKVLGTLTTNHPMPSVMKTPPQARTYERKATDENVIYFVDYPDMVQAEILWVNRQSIFDPQLVPTATLFNQYYGGDMSSVVFQNIRESKALAYSTFAQYVQPSKKEDPFYVVAYIGTQADKLAEALPAMNELLKEMPLDSGSFVLAREALRNRLQTERTIRNDVLFNYRAAHKLGLDHDIRRDIYTALDRLTLDDLRLFHDKRFGSSYSYCILGSKDKIDLKALGRYGRVVELKLEDVFGY